MTSTDITLHHGDCLDVMRALPDNSVDSVVTDPPYGLEFMGKDWDRPWAQHFTGIGDGAPLPDRQLHVNPRCKSCGGYQRGTKNKCHCETPQWSDSQAAAVARKNQAFGEWCELWAAECLRVLKPGGHMLAFGGTRTWHRLACAVEDAGFEVRDSIAWLYGSGFPKSLDVSKAIDKAAGAERAVVGLAGRSGSGRTVMDAGTRSGDLAGDYFHTAPATPDARQWQGWGTALKPAFEPVVVARKPLVGTVAANVLQHGTGALNIDACRISTGTGDDARRSRVGGFSDSPIYGRGETAMMMASVSGRWPANVVLDESQAEALDEQSGELTSGARTGSGSSDWGEGGTFEPNASMWKADAGGASRFFYVAKADQSERPRVNGTAHPTVKPLDLMRWLVRLVTPPGGTVLEPFAGSGTTVEACIVEGFRCVAIEREADYLPLIESRIARRRNPVRAIELAGEDMGLFGEVSA